MDNSKLRMIRRNLENTKLKTIFDLTDVVVNLEQENKDLKARLQWRPIETAPRDGTSILISGGKWCFDDDWEEGSNAFRSVSIAGYKKIGATYGEYVWEGELFDDRRYYHAPTHWMPLPALPEMESE